MLQVANLANTKGCKNLKRLQNPWHMGTHNMIDNPSKRTEAVAHGFSSESTRRELSDEYQHDRVEMVFENLCMLLL